MEIAKLILEYLKALIWPAIVLVALIRFWRPIHLLVGRIAKDSEEFEAFGVKAKLRPATAKEQASKIAEAAPPVLPDGPRDGASYQQRAQSTSRYLLAEELVLRVLEARWGQAIRRNWVAEFPNGRRINLDGVVETPAQITFVQVKLVRASRGLPDDVLAETSQTALALRQHFGKGVIGILALVAWTEDENFELLRKEATTRERGAPVPVVIEVFSLPQLLSQAGSPPDIDLQL